MSIFITFEGGEGSGKSTQSRRLYENLINNGLPAMLTYEPGGTHLGEAVEHWLKWEGKEISPLAELLLFNAARNQSLTEVILPNLKNGKVVISDRYADSTTVYQGYGRGLDMEMVLGINHTATQGLKPDLTILMDVPAETGFCRKQDATPDRFEQEALDFHYRIRDGYLTLASQEPERWLVVDADQDKDTIADIIWQRVKLMLSQKKGV